jgi:hypothetical protein
MTGSMANAYYIGENIKKIAPHHESFKALWDTKWQKGVRSIVRMYSGANVVSSVAWVSTLSCSGPLKISSQS